jgi:DNA mismatch repair ATPase MutS
MFMDRDFDPKHPLPSNEQALIKDLELNTLFDAMALGDDFLLEAARKAVLFGSNDLETIRYRQDILKDCLKNPNVVREIYQIPIESIENKRRRWMGIISSYPSGILSSALQMLEMYVELLTKLKNIAELHGDDFESDGFRRFFVMIKKEFDDEYMATIQEHIRELKFGDGVLLSAELGQGNEGSGYLLRKPPGRAQSWFKRLFAKKSPAYSFSINPRDEQGARTLSELTDKGINLVANAVAQSAEHVDGFFKMLQIELAFYMGCLNLYEQLTQLGEPITFPSPISANERRLSFTGLYDLCLALTMKRRIVSNDANADHKDLVVITGANQGGKSTFLRSVGLAQLMMQCGLFVPAKSFCANVCDGLFTHYKREEDVTMESGKLDEELNRMDNIVNKITPNSILLFNESFAATNEREGSEIARQIVSALLEKRVKILFVTHLYQFAHAFYEKAMDSAIFLRAEREADGRRTFKILEGEPLQTSYGEDVYQSVFKTDKENMVS